MSVTILQVVENGGRFSRYGDFLMVVLPGCAFMTPATDFQQVRQWANSKQSSGTPNRDRMNFVERFETLLARNGSGIATKGHSAVLLRLVKGMKSSGIVLDDWSIPARIYESVEIVKRVIASAPEPPSTT